MIFCVLILQGDNTTDEPIHIVNVGLKIGENEEDSDLTLARKCSRFVQAKVF